MADDKCDPEVYKDGTAVCTFHASQAVTEPWVQSVAAESGQRVDWHYMGGYAVVRFLGDRDRVVATIEKLKPELERAAEKCPRGWGLSHFRMVEP